MAQVDESQVISELNKLRKSELIDIILHKKLPESVSGSDVLDVVMKSSFKNASACGGFVNDAADTPATAGCYGCQALQREIVVYKKLSDQLELRTRDQADLIHFYKTNNGYIGGKNAHKGGFAMCRSVEINPHNLASVDVKTVSDENISVKRSTDIQVGKKRSTDRPHNKQILAGSVTRSAVHQGKAVSSGGPVSEKQVAAGILLAETQVALDKYVNLDNHNPGSQMEKKDRQEWQNVRSKKRRRSVLVGSKDSAPVKGVPSSVHLHVYRVDPKTTADQLADMLRPSFPEVTCDVLVPRHPELYASFKVAIHSSNFRAAMDASLWPQGACISRFLFPRREKTSTAR